MAVYSNSRPSVEAATPATTTPALGGPVALRLDRRLDRRVASGPAKAIAKEKRSYTGAFLKPVLARRQRRTADTAGDEGAEGGGVSGMQWGEEVEERKRPPAELASPRHRGIGEHLQRAQYLLDLALREKDDAAKYRLMLAAVYSCRAITELMLEAAEKQEVKGLDDPKPKTNRDALETQISPMLPYYALIERIRIHDFHRFGITPPDPHMRQVMLGGPVRLTARKGAAMATLTADGPLYRTTGDSKVDLRRPLLVDDGLIFDDDSKKYVSLEDILKAFLPAAVKVIDAFISSTNQLCP